MWCFEKKSYNSKKKLPQGKFSIRHCGLNGSHKTCATDNLMSARKCLHCGLVAFTDNTLEEKNTYKNK